MEDVYKMINHVLVNLINEIWELEEKAIIHGSCQRTNCNVQLFRNG